METLLRELLHTLGEIGETHPELYDSDVREAMREAICHSFLKPDLDYSLPNDFKMASDQANLLVRRAIESYTTAAGSLADERGLDFKGRYAAFQNDEVEDNGPEHLTYDAAFGYVPADAYDDLGNSK